MSESLKKSTVKGVVWSAMERMSGQIVGFVVVVIMSRMLTQADYGLVGMLVIFIDIAQTLTDSGVTQALIRKQDRTQKDCATAFFFNIVLSILLYAVLYMISPWIAKFYDQPQLELLTRVISIGVVINAFMMVQKALFSINVDFKTQTKASLTAAIVSGLVGILMAYSSFGVWSIVYYQIVNQIVTVVLLWAYSKWRPTMEFSISSLKYFFNFGSKLTLAGLMHTIYKNMYLAAIGKVYQSASVGLYTRAHQFGALPSYNVNNIVQRVSYPVLCKLQDDNERLCASFMKFIRLTSFGVFPMMVGLAVVSTPLVKILLGDSWAYSGKLLSIMCLYMMWLPIDSLNLNLLQVRGRTDCFLKCEIWKKVFGVTLLFATLPMGLEIMCWGQVVRAFIDLIVDSYYTNKFLGLSLLRQIKGLLPSLIYSCAMGLIMCLSIHWLEFDWSKLGVGVVVGVTAYFSMAHFTSSSDLNEIKQLVGFKRQRK